MTAAQAAAAHRLVKPLGGLYYIQLARLCLESETVRKAVDLDALASDLGKAERDVRIMTGEVTR